MFSQCLGGPKLCPWHFRPLSSYINFLHLLFQFLFIYLSLKLTFVSFSLSLSLSLSISIPPSIILQAEARSCGLPMGGAVSSEVRGGGEAQLQGVRVGAIWKRRCKWLHKVNILHTMHALFNQGLLLRCKLPGSCGLPTHLPGCHWALWHGEPSAQQC